MIEEIPVFILHLYVFRFIFRFHKIPHMVAAATGVMFSWVFYVACMPLGNDLAQYLISTIIVSAYAEVDGKGVQSTGNGIFDHRNPAVGAGRRHLLHDGILCFGQTAQFIETGIHTFAIAGALASGFWWFPRWCVWFTR